MGVCVCYSYCVHSTLEYDRNPFFPDTPRCDPDVSAKPSSQSNVPSLSTSPHLSATSPPLLLSLSLCRVSLITSQCNTPTGQSLSVPSHPSYKVVTN